MQGGGGVQWRVYALSMSGPEGCVNSVALKFASNGEQNISLQAMHASKTKQNEVTPVGGGSECKNAVL